MLRMTDITRTITDASTCMSSTPIISDSGHDHHNTNLITGHVTTQRVCIGGAMCVKVCKRAIEGVCAV